MLFSTQQKVASALGLAMAVSSAPANERSKLNLFERGVGLGWLCHYDGLAAASVDASLNLPLMLGGLCAKVNYEYDGCDSFMPAPKPDQGNDVAPLSAQSAPQDENSNDDPKHHVKPKHHKKPKHTAAHPDSSSDSQSFNSVSNTPNAAAGSHSSHHKKPKHAHHGQGSAGAQSFNESGDDDTPKSSSVGALAAADGSSDQCTETEYYSSELNKCVDKSSFSAPNGDMTCKNGNLDALLKLCLDVPSVLGITGPIHAESTVLPYSSGSTGQDSCQAGQQLSSLLNLCVDQKFFSTPLADNECQNGWKLDLVFGICLDILGCQNHDSSN